MPILKMPIYEEKVNYKTGEILGGEIGHGAKGTYHVQGGV
jgi:hypothetical protein